MRTIVRLLPRLLLLGVAAGALLFLLDRARAAQAAPVDPVAESLTDPSAAPAPAVTTSLPPAPALPTTPTPPPVPSLPPAPAPPSVPTAPTLPAPALSALPAAPTPPAVPSAPVPDPGPPAPPPSLPGPAIPSAPAIPVLVPTVDPDAIRRTVGPLPAVPSVSAPAPALPELPALPGGVPPLETVLGLAAAPVGAPASVEMPDRAPAVPVPDLIRSRTLMPDADWAFAAANLLVAPARAPPPAPAAPLPACPGGGTSHLSLADPAGSFSPRLFDTIRRTGLRVDARSYGSTTLLDPLLRPD